MNKQIWSSWSVLYIVMGIVSVTMDVNLTRGFTVAAFILFLGFVHAYFRARKAEAIDWGNVMLPVVIVDWGKDGESFELPEHVRGCVLIPCPGSEVDFQLQEAKKELKNSGNWFVIHNIKDGPRLPFVTFKFRIGKAACETQEEYINKITKHLEKIIPEWHQTLIGNQHIKSDFYNKNYVLAGLNGSAVK